jgi:hypothetical protein
VSSALKIVTFIVVLAVQLICKRHGLTTSGILLFFWVVMALAGIVTFRSVLISGHLSGDEKVLPLITASVQYPIVLAAFFLTCWADPKPRYVHIDGKSKRCKKHAYEDK